jgi:hypothetical protein
MASNTSIEFEGEILVMQLESYKLAAHAFRDLIDHNLIEKELLSFKVEIAQGYIDQLEVYEELGDQIKCGYAIDNANHFLEQIKVMLEKIVYQ